MSNVSSSNGLEKYPKLRFSGFQGEWGEVLLSDLFSKISTKNTNKEIKNVICNSAKLGLIPQREYFDKDIANTENISGYYVITKGDFVYNPRKSNDAPYGPVSVYEYENKGVVSPLYLCFSPVDSINTGFFSWYFKSSVWHRYVYLAGDSGVRHDRVSMKDSIFFAMPLHIPSNEEQQKIAAFLTLLDKRIAKQRELVESLKSYKRGVLSRLFPRKGETTPQYRFSGFTDAWEQRKLYDIAGNTYGGGTPKTSNDEFWNGDIPWIQSQDIIENKVFDVEPRKYISNEAITKSATKLVPEKSIAIVTRVGVGKLAFMPFSYCTSQDFLSLSDIKIDSIYATYSIYKMLQKEKQNAQGTSIKGITIEEMLSKQISAPNDSAEQQQIGSFFSNLDTLITLHQRKLNEFETVKAGLLQQLFI